MKNVLFLCTGNSCRSQLAEAIINRELDGAWKAYSAGIEPEKEVNHFTLDALSEVGIDHSFSRPKHFTEFEGIEFDVVITLSERAALECPHSCDAACQGCLLTHDTQHHLTDLNRHTAIALLSESFLAALDLPEEWRAFGSSSRLEMEPLP